MTQEYHINTSTCALDLSFWKKTLAVA